MVCITNWCKLKKSVPWLKCAPEERRHFNEKSINLYFNYCNYLVRITNYCKLKKSVPWLKCTPGYTFLFCENTVAGLKLPSKNPRKRWNFLGLFHFNSAKSYVTKFNSGAMIYSDTFVLIYYKGGVIVFSIITNIVEQVIAGLLVYILIKLFDNFNNYKK